MQIQRNLDWNSLIEILKNFCTSEMGKSEIQKISPLDSPDRALLSFANIQSAQVLIRSGLRPFMTSLDFFHPWALRVKKKAQLKTIELKDIRNYALEVYAFREALKLNINPGWITSQYETLWNSENLIEEIDNIITPSGEIRSDASERLFRLIKEKEKLAKDVHTTMDKLVRTHQMENIVQDKYVTTREGRWVLPVKSGMQHSLDGIIHASSQSRQTVFMEPEIVVPMNNRLRQIDIEIEEEIEIILNIISGKVHQLNDEIQESYQILLDADLILAKAQLSEQIHARECEFSDEFHLMELRHPVLFFKDSQVISNNISLNISKRILLLSGPNAGGKTVLLKSIGLAAEMARCGLPICTALPSKIPFFKKILTGIGDNQSVSENLSTFAAHLKILADSSSLKGSDSLVLIDEICGSTDPEEGSALARSFIEVFSKNEIFAIVTSHLSPLKTGWSEESAVLNGSLEYDQKTGRPTYQFISGIAGDSMALQTARRVGIANPILDRAFEILSPATQARMKAIDEIEVMRQEIHQLQNQLKKDLHLADQQKRKYEELLKKINQEKEDLLSKTVKKAEKKVEEAIALARAEQVFKKHQSLQEIKFQLPEIVKAKKVDSPTGEITSAEEFTKRFPPGTKVFVPSLSQDGIVQSTPNAKGEVMILSQSLRLQLSWKELKLPHSLQNPTSQLIRQSTSRVQVALSDEERTLDVRGKTVEVALEELEIQLDRAAESKEDRIKIIHGHGTEALKKAIRSYLSRSVYVKKWKAGNPENGGDGITWAEIGEGY